MTVRRIGASVAVVTLAASGTYLFVYLYRWEWNRALVAGVFLLATEVALAAYAVLSRLRTLELALARPEPVARAAVLQRLRETAPTPRNHFAWLKPDAETAVFVPMLMGVGFLFSALAWAVERLARATASPTLERRLADRLAVFTLPEDHLLARLDPEPRERFVLESRRP